MNEFIELFNDTDFDDDLFLDNHYITVNVSYFNHWLTEEEFENAELYCYAQVKNDLNKKILFDHIAGKFFAFYKKLYELEPRPLCTVDDGIKKIQTYESYYQIVANAMKEQPICTIVYPKLEILTLTGYDFTHEFFIAKKDPQKALIKKRMLTEIANSVGLHVID